MSNILKFEMCSYACSFKSVGPGHDASIKPQPVMKPFTRLDVEPSGFQGLNAAALVALHMHMRYFHKIIFEFSFRKKCNEQTCHANVHKRCTLALFSFHHS